MIRYHYKTNYRLLKSGNYTTWLIDVIRSEEGVSGEINYVFMEDDGLLEMNRQFLNHDFYTDILTFDYTKENLVSGDIFISIERVKENALTYGVSTEDELRRVMVHGILHLMGYTDGSEGEKEIIRNKENDKMKMFHVEQ